MQAETTVTMIVSETVRLTYIAMKAVLAELSLNEAGNWIPRMFSPASPNSLRVEVKEPVLILCPLLDPTFLGLVLVRKFMMDVIRAWQDNVYLKKY